MHHLTKDVVPRLEGGTALRQCGMPPKVLERAARKPSTPEGAREASERAMPAEALHAVITRQPIRQPVDSLSRWIWMAHLELP
jgi:hypothetical protein